MKFSRLKIWMFYLWDKVSPSANYRRVMSTNIKEWKWTSFAILFLFLFLVFNNTLKSEKQIMESVNPERFMILNILLMLIIFMVIPALLKKSK